jgi:hypothetical protein
VWKITVSPSPIELGFFGEQWEAFEADLESAGHQVEIEQPLEERSGRGWLPRQRTKLSAQ